MSVDRQQVVLVTGASSGIGLACGDATFATLRMDVTDEQSVPDGVQAIAQQAGRLDVVINCAGFGYAGAVEDHSMLVPLSRSSRCMRAPLFRRACSSGPCGNITGWDEMIKRSLGGNRHGYPDR